MSRENANVTPGDRKVGGRQATRQGAFLTHRGASLTRHGAFLTHRGASSTPRCALMQTKDLRIAGRECLGQNDEELDEETGTSWKGFGSGCKDGTFPMPFWDQKGLIRTRHDPKRTRCGAIPTQHGAIWTRCGAIPTWKCSVRRRPARIVKSPELPQCMKMQLVGRASGDGPMAGKSCLRRAGPPLGPTPAPRPARCVRAALRSHDIRPFIPHRGDQSGLGAIRGVAERTAAWLNQFRRLRVRYERREDIHEAFLLIGCAIICWNFLQPWF